jgi:hypothetical protein
MPIETRYATHDLVLMAIDFSFKILASLFLGENFVLYPDLKSLGYLFSHKELNLRQLRWLEFLALMILMFFVFSRKGEIVLPMHLVIGNKRSFL